MRMELIAALAVLLTGCATDSANTASQNNRQAQSGVETSYTNDDMIALMFSAAPRDDKKTLARIEMAKKQPLGDKTNPVRAYQPPGQRAYLSRLNCANGSAPSFKRIGSFGAGPYETIIDGYNVVCSGSEPAKSTIYIDMYFPGHVETQAVPGFTIDAP